MAELKLNINKRLLRDLRRRIEEVLMENIVPFWLAYSVDEENDGFWGRVSNENVPVRNAPKGLILNSRILWTFSVLYQKYREEKFLVMAERAWQYLLKYFWDGRFGGMYWLVNAFGDVVDDKKKMYGQAFTIFAMSEYVKVTGKKNVLQRAIDIFELMLRHNYDRVNGGFLEASGRDWSAVADMRLSEKDLNAEKSMNTHLHIMEAFTAFYRIWPDAMLKNLLTEVTQNFLQHVFNEQTGHLNLFFDRQWQVLSKAISFGHDIEASWLLQETLNVLNDETLSEQGKRVAEQLAENTLRDGMSADYAIFKEKMDDGFLVPVLEWWQQAEAAVGFAYAYLLTGRDYFWEAAVKAWNFIEKHLINEQYGEWYYEVDIKGRPNLNSYKVSEWKGPYHNSRACIELLKCVAKLREGLDELVSK